MSSQSTSKHTSVVTNYTKTHDHRHKLHLNARSSSQATPKRTTVVTSQSENVLVQLVSDINLSFLFLFFLFVFEVFHCI